MTAALLLALSIDGVVSSAQSGFEGDYDLSFGMNGYTVDQEDVDPAAADEFQSLFYTGELLPDGSIIAGGNYVSTANRGDFYLRKFTSGGAVVTTFGSNGLVRTNFHTRHDGLPGNDSPSVLKVQPDGKIVFAGTCDVLEPGPCVRARCLRRALQLQRHARRDFRRRRHSPLGRAGRPRE